MPCEQFSQRRQPRSSRRHDMHQGRQRHSHTPTAAYSRAVRVNPHSRRHHSGELWLWLHKRASQAFPGPVARRGSMIRRVVFERCRSDSVYEVGEVGGWVQDEGDEQGAGDVEWPRLLELKMAPAYALMKDQNQYTPICSRTRCPALFILAIRCRPPCRRTSTFLRLPPRQAASSSLASRIGPSTLTHA